MCACVCVRVCARSERAKRERKEGEAVTALSTPALALPHPPPGRPPPQPDTHAHTLACPSPSPPLPCPPARLRFARSAPPASPLVTSHRPALFHPRRRRACASRLPVPAMLCCRTQTRRPCGACRAPWSRRRLSGPSRTPLTPCSSLLTVRTPGSAARTRAGHGLGGGGRRRSRERGASRRTERKARLTSHAPEKEAFRLLLPAYGLPHQRRQPAQKKTGCRRHTLHSREEIGAFSTFASPPRHGQPRQL